MRRVLLLLAVVLAGAGRPASGQDRARVVVSLDSFVGDSRNVIFHLDGLLSDPTWRDIMLKNAYPISLHWKIQAWQKGGLFGIGAHVRGTLEWDITIEPKLVLGQYVYTRQFTNRSPIVRVFTSLDSLDSELGTFYNAPSALVPHDPGDWYYLVELTITTLKPEQLATLQRYMNRSGTDRSGQTGAVTQFLQGAILGGGLPHDAQTVQSETFTIRRRGP